jgi:Holliday junction resolvase RusA-like endonuclease
MPEWALWIPGKPIPKGRPRFYNGHALTPKATHDYEKRIADAWLDKYGFEILEDEQLTIHVDVYSKTAGRADVDNYLKIAMDGLQNFAYPNDSKIVSAKVTKTKVATPDDEGMRIFLTNRVLLSKTI